MALLEDNTDFPATQALLYPFTVLGRAVHQQL